MTSAVAELPKALRSLDVVDNLTNEGIREFCGKLQYVQQLGRQAVEFFEKDSNESTLVAEFIDSFELDLYANISIGGRREITPWIVHSSWTFETKQDELFKELTRDVIVSIKYPCPEITGSLEETIVFMGTISRALLIALENVFSTNSLQQAIANLIAVDLLLLKMLTHVVSCRFNPNLVLRP